MRDDLDQRLQVLSDRLFEVVMIDADPVNWPGYGKLPTQLTQEERGDATWARKMALASLMLLERVNVLAGEGQPTGGSGEDPDVEQQVRRAEREASRLLEKIARGRKG